MNIRSILSGIILIPAALLVGCVSFGGKPPKQIMLADLPTACKTVLNAPAKTISAGVH